MNSFNAKSKFKIGGKEYTLYRLASLEKAGVTKNIERLPFSIRILLENVLRNEDGKIIRRQDIEALASWSPRKQPHQEIAFTPSRVILQDFTGVPAVVDLAAMRDAVGKMGGDPSKVNPIKPVDLVIDHSLQVDVFGLPEALEQNQCMEFERNQERYQFLRWGSQAFRNFRVVPPGTGIIHQVNLEYLASGVLTKEEQGETFIYPDTLVGTDSHTTMINGLGVLGWGVGGIEAEAAMLGQPITMLIPEVVGVKIKGKLRQEATATDAVLTLTEILRKKGVVGRFVEFFGPGLNHLSLADRATLANMAPEYGATIGFFPVDDETLNYLRLTGRSEELIELVENYYKEQGLFRKLESPDPVFSDVLEFDLESVEACLAGPKRPQDRFPLSKVKPSFYDALKEIARADAQKKSAQAVSNKLLDEDWSVLSAVREQETTTQTATSRTEENALRLRHGSVVIASITSCTNTSNPAVMLGAGLLARKAVERGLEVKPWVKTSLAPGSQVVVDYLIEAGLLPFLEKMKFNVVGFGCATCIGNSGPLPESVSSAIEERDLIVASVLSGNRNFEGRIHPLIRANYLASPPLVVAYAIAGRIDIDFMKEPLGRDPEGNSVYLRDLWPTFSEIQGCLKVLKPETFSERYQSVFNGDAKWRSLEAPTGKTFSWRESSTYIMRPPYFEGLTSDVPPRSDIENARVLVSLGDSITTDHISPAGSIPADSPAGKYLLSREIPAQNFNSYGSRRGNHEVMIRGTFANIRLRNGLVPDSEGGLTRHFPDGKEMSVFDAAMQYCEEGIPLIILAGQDYGTGSSRDWAAKGPALLGVKAVIAESFERIHRSNLIGMGILPLQFVKGETRTSLGLTGEEIYSVAGIVDNLTPHKELLCQALSVGHKKTFKVMCRIDTPAELGYYQNDGILQYVCRQMAT